MIQELIHNVLFIDDDYETYCPVLQPVALNQGFNLYEVSNVSEGLTLLIDYPGAIDAVLLDITFGVGEMQGLEALKEIKKLHPLLPVVMLTGSDKASDLHKVVDCMRNGAFDYIGKHQLDPVKLFEVLYDSIQKSKQQFRLENRASDGTGQKGFFYTLSSLNHGNFNENACFGFRLISVNKPRNQGEEEQMRLYAIQWHINLLRSINFAYKDNLAINLKFLAGNGRFDIFILFTLSEKNISSLKSSLSNLFQDIRSFFIPSSSDVLCPFVFDEIRDEKFLLGVDEVNRKSACYVFYRKPLQINEPQGIGFTKTGGETIIGNKEKSQEILMPFPAVLKFDNTLLSALVFQEEAVEIDIMLKPRNLLIEEIRSIKNVLQKPTMLRDNIKSQFIKSYTDYLEQFLLVAEDKYAVSLTVKGIQPQFDNFLRTAIINYFFGSSPDIEISARNCNNPRRFSTDPDKDTIQLPFIYTRNDILQVFHLPLPDCKYLPGLRQQSHIFLKVPSDIPQNGITLGEKLKGKKRLNIKISQEDLARHLYIMGQTGTGKSTMLKTMIADCLRKDLPFTLIDPHGDLFDEVYDLMQVSGRKNAVIIDMKNPANSAKFNPINFDEKNPQSKSLVINELIKIFGYLYDMKMAGGPMFETYLKNGLLLVMDERVRSKIGVATILNLIEVFFNNNYRKELMGLCDNISVRNFFGIAEQNSGDWSFNNFATYITSKLTRFAEDEYITPIITAKDNNINFRRLIDEESILLVKMHKGLVGADNVSLLGQMIVSSLGMAAMSRTDIDKTHRKNYYLFIDEFQNFIKGDISSALSEVRKYGLNMILANQTLGQLKDNDNNVIEGLLGNVGSMVFFRPGINDYEKVRHFFEPDFDRTDVLKLPNFNCIARIMIDNVPSDPFVFQTIHH